MTDYSYGCLFDPFDPNTFASYSIDGTQVHMWDIRNLKDGNVASAITKSVLFILLFFC